MDERKHSHKESRKCEIVNSKIELRCLQARVRPRPTGFPFLFITVLYDFLSAFSGVFIFAINAPSVSFKFSCRAGSAMSTVTFSFCSSAAGLVSAPTFAYSCAGPPGATLFSVFRFITDHLLVFRVTYPCYVVWPSSRLLVP